jgi:hypothetical protein
MRGESPPLWNMKSQIFVPTGRLAWQWDIAKKKKAEKFQR